jgi:hypothetical protein
LPGVAEKLGQVAGQTMALIEGPQGQKAGIAGDLTAREVSHNGLMAVEGEREL